MAAGVGEVDEVSGVIDLSDAAPPCPAAADAAGTGGPGSPGAGSRRTRRLLAAASAAVVVLGAGLWQQHLAHRAAEREATAAAAAAAAQDGGRWLTSDADAPSASATATGSDADPEAVAAAAQRAVAGVLSASGPQARPAWSPPDLHVGGQAVDLQAGGGWAPTADGVQRVAYRLLTGAGPTAGEVPCLVPTVRIDAWQYAQGGDAALPCRVMAAGGRGTALREGSAGTGPHEVQVREVVLVSGGRVASVATWSIGGTSPVLDVPTLGAAAAALLATAPAAPGDGTTARTWAESMAVGDGEP